MRLFSTPFRVENFPERLKFVGTFGNPEYVASYLGACLCFVLSFPGEVSLRRSERLAYGTLFVVGLALAHSQGAWVALAVTFLVRNFRALAKHRFWLLVTAVLVVILIPLAVPQLHWHTMRGRLFLDRVAWEMFLRAGWHGVGLDQFQHYYLETQRRFFLTGGFATFTANAGFATRAHNELLDFLAEGGPALGIAIAVALAALARRVRAMWHREPGYVAVTLFLLTHSLFSFPLHLLPTLLLFGFACARLGRSTAYEHEWRVGIGNGRRAIAFAIFVVVVTAQSVLSLSAYDTREAELAARANDRASAARFVARATALTPGNPDVLLLTARLQYLDFHSQAALRTLEKMERLGQRVDTLKLRGLALLDLGRWDEAKRVYDELTTAIPWQITSHFYLGYLALRAGNEATAERELRTVLTTRPTNTKAVLDKARARALLAELE